MNTKTIPKLSSMSPQFLVADLEKALIFYTQKMGFIVDFRYGDFYAGISRDGHSIHLKNGNKQEGGQTEDLDVLFGVIGIESLSDELSSSGVQIAQPLRDMPYGREFYICDPDGYLLGFLETKKDA
jgi:predicted enzyme related to lactoylglutathione lyase